MTYKIHFIGLHCFVPSPGGKRRALLPDGRFPDPSIEPHTASISVRTSDLVSRDGWRDDEMTSDADETEFFLKPSIIDLPFPRRGSFRQDAAFASLPRLRKLDRKFSIGRSANWIANIPIKNGSFKAFRVPGVPDPNRAPLLGELTVDYDQEIVIGVTARKGWPQRRIVLRPGSEIAIINTSRGLAPGKDDITHFQLYAELSTVPVTLSPPKRDDSEVPFSPSLHPIMTRPRPATFSEGCVPTSGG